MHSVRSLYVEVLTATGAQIGRATAFLVRRAPDDLFLITNRHVVTGRHQETGEPLSKLTAAPPSALRCVIPAVKHLRTPTDFLWSYVVVALEDDQYRHLWLEHPTRRDAVDVVAIPLSSHLVRAPEFSPTRKAALLHWLPRDAEGSIADVAVSPQDTEPLIAGTVLDVDTLTQHMIHMPSQLRCCNPRGSCRLLASP
jgi:hypothetical protein